jgi:hypothetical protein
MYGKLTVVFALSAAAATTGMFKDSPERAHGRSATLVAAEFFDSVKQPDVVSRLRNLLAEFDAHPSMQLAHEVEEAFAAFDDHLAELRKQAGRSVGGLRAELEIRRIELERERELHLQRFQAASRATSFAAPEVPRGTSMQLAASVLGGTFAD